MNQFEYSRMSNEERQRYNANQQAIDWQYKNMTNFFSGMNIYPVKNGNSMNKNSDWAELSIQLKKLNNDLEHQLNEQNYKAAFAISVKMVSVSIKLRQWTWEKLPK